MYGQLEQQRKKIIIFKIIYYIITITTMVYKDAQISTTYRYVP